MKKHLGDFVDLTQQKREIDILSLCKHPNIIKFIESFHNEKSFYIVLEYMEGQTLFKYF